MAVQCVLLLSVVIRLSVHALLLIHRASFQTIAEVSTSHHEPCKTLSHVGFPAQSHAGLFNLSVVILLAVNSRLIIENLMKYGLLLRFEVSHLTQALRDWPLLVCALSVPLFPGLAVAIEKWKAAAPALSEKVCRPTGRMQGIWIRKSLT